MTVLGFDISSRQHPTPAPIDFAAARAAGFEFVIVKSTQGATYTNPYFARDLAAARAAGLTATPYHWVSPTSSPASQVANILTALRGNHTTSQGPVGLDFEETGASHQLLDAIRAGLRVAGYQTMTYTYPSFWKANGSTPCQQCAADPLWWAWDFPETPTAAAVAARGFNLAPWHQVSVWQYAGTSVTIPGVPGRNDGNRLLAPYMGGTPGPTPAPLPVQEDDMAYLAQGTTSGIWIVDGNRAKHVPDMPDVQAYQAAGLKLIQLSDALITELAGA